MQLFGYHNITMVQITLSVLKYCDLVSLYLSNVICIVNKHLQLPGIIAMFGIIMIITIFTIVIFVIIVVIGAMTTIPIITIIPYINILTLTISPPDPFLPPYHYHFHHPPPSPIPGLSSSP